MTNFKFEDLDFKTQLMYYVKVSAVTEPKAIFCTSNPDLQAAGDELIAEGRLVEIEGPGGADRAFALTEKGDFPLTVSSSVKIDETDH